MIGDPAKDLMRVEIDEFYKTFTGAMLILKPDSSFETGKVKGKKILDRYIALLKPHTKLFAYGIVSSLLITILGIVSSVFNNVLFDEILPYKQVNVLKMVIIVFLGINISQVAVSFVRQWMMVHLSIKIDIPLMLGYFEHIYKLPMKFFSTRKTSDITTRFSKLIYHIKAS